MKQSRLLHFFVALWIGAIAAIPAPVYAEDIEIFLGDDTPDGEQVLPNVLFILDTSGSMSTFVDGTGMNRLDNMKQALNLILSSASNVNVGLARFTDPGGPILYPVSNIDSLAVVAEGGAAGGLDTDISAPLARDDDDASELAGTLTTNDNELIFGPVTTGTGGSPSFLTLATGDSRNQQPTGPIDTSNDFLLRANRLGALRFQNISIPRGATVLDAHLDLRARRDDAGANNTTIRGEATDSAATIGTADNDISSRPATAASVVWALPPFVQDDPYYASPSIASIIQEIVCRGITAATATAACPAAGAPYPTGTLGGWNTGQSIVLLTTSDAPNGQQRRAYSHQGAGSNATRRPQLRVTYQVPGVSLGSNIAGIRFQNVSIPRGATITSASITFTAAQTQGDTATVMQISGELADDATAYSSGANVTGRTYTAPTTWDTATGLTDWTAGTTYTTPNLSAAVQQIVSQGGWCGNNAMAFKIETTAGIGRTAHSFNGDPALAPVLHIEFDGASVPATGGCINQIFQYQVASSDGDAEQTNSTGAVSLGSNIINMRSSQTNGYRFSGLSIPQGATVLEANLIFTADDVDTGAVSLTYKAEANDNAAAFSAAANDITNRPTTTAAVTETPPAWDSADTEYQSADITSLINEVSSRANWQPGNSLVIIQTATGAGQRDAKSFNQSAAQAAKLRLKIEFTGAVLPSDYTTVRSRLQTVVDDLPHDGFTPIVGSLFEGAQYYRGGPVTHGRKRSHTSQQDNTTRVSHPATYEGGFHYIPPGCASSNLNSDSCVTEKILKSGEINLTTGTTVATDPIYKSPIEQGCQANYIVFLSDGIANHNDQQDGVDHERSLIETLVGGTCAQEPPPGEVSSSDIEFHGETCGRELAKFLSEEDQDGNASNGKQAVKIYTIGFDLAGQGLDDAVDFLQELAIYGDGIPENNPDEPNPQPVDKLNFYDVANASELAAVFQQILDDIANQPSSFATPKIAVNAFNRLLSRTDIYLTLFEASRNIRWPGNVKKYKICDQDTVNVDNCELGDIIDANSLRAVDDSTKLIKDTAKSIWSSAADGAFVKQGGAGEQLVLAGHAARNIYSDIDGATTDLTTAANRIEVGNTSLTETLLGVPAADRDELIAWIRGQDVDDEDEDDDVNDTRFAFEDSLHASPIAVQFGGTPPDSFIDKLFVATNGGGLRLINTENGREEWDYIPVELLDRQQDFRLNASSNTRIYGLDLTPFVWVFDQNTDGVIEPAEDDFVRVLQGMRRGGRNYYAVEAVPPATGVTSATAVSEVNPKLLWKILGGTTPGFEDLSQTWSLPKVTEIQTSTGRKEVAIFGGGHNEALDKSFGTSNIGNIIYIVEAETGNLLASIGGSNTTASLKIPAMDCSIPSELGFLDSNGDNATDRLYFGDGCGQVWRVDINGDVGVDRPGGAVIGGTLNITVGLLADLSEPDGAVPGPLATETRKFYDAPAIVQAVDEQFSTAARFDLVLLSSGNRPDPLNQTVHDAFYALRDFKVTNLNDLDADGDGLAGPADLNGDGDTVDLGEDFKTITTADLFDLTNNPFQLNTAGDPVTAANFDQSNAGSAVSQIREDDGWILKLVELGEKGISKPLVIAGKLFFTTYLPVSASGDPQQDDASCEVVLGESRVWGINVLSGAALFADWDNDGTSFSNEDRFLNLGGGMGGDLSVQATADAISLLTPTGQAAEGIDPGVGLPRERTFWYQR